MGDVQFRDAMIDLLVPGAMARDGFTPAAQQAVANMPPVDHAHTTDYLARLCRKMPDRCAAPTLTVLATYAWHRHGNKALAERALDRAVRCLPGYRLATLMEQMVDADLRQGETA